MISASLPTGSSPVGEEPVVCDVAVCRPLHRRFTYLVPPALRDGCRPGARVIVPFGRVTVTGFVVGPGPVPPPDPSTLKAVAEVVDPDPPLPERHLELAAWLSATTCCSEGEALAAMVPTRAVERVERWVRLGADPERVKRRIRGNARRQFELLEVLREGPVARGELLRKGAWVSATLASLRDRGLIEEYVPEPEAPVEAPCEDLEPFKVLTPAQEAAYGAVSEVLPPAGGGAFLLHGVTGSGKTEVYLHLIRRCRDLGMGAIFLVPEISLTVPMIRLFRRRFGSAVAVLHSRLTPTERYGEWMRIRRGEAAVVLGARSAVFAPVPRLGLVVLDEEGEDSYKQQDSPRYHARAVALERASRVGAAVVLGSATPCLETWAAALEGRVTRLVLPERIAERPMPEVTLVDMADEFALRRNRSVFSMELKRRMAETLGGDGQVLLFLNRRGHSTYVFCRACSYVVECPECSVGMTWHFTERRLMCHACGRAVEPPTRCPSCGGSAIRYCGAGTQKVEEEFRLNFPAVPYARMDSDSTGGRTSHAAILDEFEAGRARVLIGTQMVARGFDFPRLDLAGIVNADATLRMPDFRAAERTFILVTQVAGRVGRGDRPCHVVVQTYDPEHPALTAAARHDYETFAAEELELRRELRYPPFSRLVAVVAQHKEEAAAQADLDALAASVEGVEGADGTWPYVLGPAPAFTPKVRNVFRWQMLIKLPPGESPLMGSVRELLVGFAPPRRSRITVDVDPVSPP